MTANDLIPIKLPLSLNIESLDSYSNSNSPPTASTSNLPLLNFSTQSTQKRRKNPPPSLILQPASPSTSTAPLSFPARSLPSPLIINSNGLTAKRQINKKQLSLVLKDASIPAALMSPSDPSRLDIKDESGSIFTRSLPSSPISLSTFIGVEGVELADRTIGRLMMKQRKEEADEMREQMKGGIRRRTSIPRLNLSTTASTSSSNNSNSRNLGSTNGGSAVRMIKTNSTERNHHSSIDEVEESFPYENGPREILKGIWLGSEQNARDPKVLKDWGITHVLNVAKEVICPWDNEVIAEEKEEKEKVVISQAETLVRSTTLPIQSTSIIPPLLQRRTNTTTPNITTSKPLPSESPFVRSTTSTPNLKSVFKSSSNSPPPPPVPPLPPSLSSIPDASTTSTPTVSTPTITSSQSILFPSDPQTGRPALNWLWLKWSHDEANLVESHKLEKAFEFIDDARLSQKNAGGGGGGQNRILIHCQCGVSRSATVVIAFCMREAARALEGGRLGSEEETEELKSITGMHEAYSFVKEKSAFIGPNLSLVFQLVAYERVLRGAPPLQDDDDDEDQDSREDSTRQTDSNSPSTNSPRTPISEHESIHSSTTFSSGSSDASSHVTTPGKLKITPVVKVLEQQEEEGKDSSKLLEVIEQDNSPSRLKVSRPHLHNDVQSDPVISSLPSIEIPSPRRQQSLPPLLPQTLAQTRSKANHSRGKSTSNFFPFTSSKIASTPSAIPLFLRDNEPHRIRTPSPDSSSGNKLFGGATKDERRASHRRVFSLEGFNLFNKSSS